MHHVAVQAVCAQIVHAFDCAQIVYASLTAQILRDKETREQNGSSILRQQQFKDKGRR